MCRCEYPQEILSIFFPPNYTLFKLRNLTKMKDTTETVRQRNFTETAQLCSYEGHAMYAFLLEMVIWSFKKQFKSFLVRLSVTNAWNCHSLYTAFSSNVGAWGMWACSLFLSFQMILRSCTQWMKLSNDWHVYKINKKIIIAYTTKRSDNHRLDEYPNFATFHILHKQTAYR